MNKLIYAKLLVLFAVNFFIISTNYCGKKHFKLQRKTFRPKYKKRTCKTYKQKHKLQKKQKEIVKNEKARRKFKTTLKKNKLEKILKPLFFSAFCLTPAFTKKSPDEYDMCLKEWNEDILVCCDYFQTGDYIDLKNYDKCKPSLFLPDVQKCCKTFKLESTNHQRASTIAIPASIFTGLTIQTLIICIFGKKILKAVRMQSKQSYLKTPKDFEMESSTTSIESDTEGQPVEVEDSSETTDSESAL